METRDLGSTVHGMLPVDARNPIVIVNDNAFDNWQGGYAILFAHDGGPQLAAIVVSTSGPWPDINANVAGWRSMVAAARAGGMTEVPDPVASVGPFLTRPADGQFLSTTPNRS